MENKDKHLNSLNESDLDSVSGGKNERERDPSLEFVDQIPSNPQPVNRRRRRNTPQ